MADDEYFRAHPAWFDNLRARLGHPLAQAEEGSWPCECTLTLTGPERQLWEFIERVSMGVASRQYQILTIGDSQILCKFRSRFPSPRDEVRAFGLAAPEVTVFFSYAYRSVNLGSMMLDMGHVLFDRGVTSPPQFDD